MAIRSTAKAILLKEGQVLLNQCRDRGGEVYYDLPGGGQRQFETLEEALYRECLEETGRRVRILRLAALCEEMFEDPWLRAHFSEYTHRVHHIFLAELRDGAVAPPGERDYQQAASVWVPLDKLPSLDVRPRLAGEHFGKILASPCPLYLGARRYAAP